MTDAAEPKVSPPQQSRSRRTLERLVRASLEILEKEGPAGLTVHNVVARAKSSVGSFYARFRGKDDLLDYLGEHVWQEALDRWNDSLASHDWSALELPQLIEGAVTLLADAQRSRAMYLEALDRIAGGRNDAYAEFRRHLLAGLERLLLARASEMDHPNPALAVRLGLRGVMGVIDSEPRSGDEALSRETLVRECADLLSGYLMGTAPRGDAEGVDFFEIWG